MGSTEGDTPEGEQNRGENGQRQPKPSTNWLRASFGNPDNLPRHLTALFTLLLAIFAYQAWTEAQRETRALEGELTALEADQRPYLGLANFIEQPLFVAQSNQAPLGQVVWKWQYMNYGRGIAYNVHFRDFIKVGDERYQPSYGGTGESVSLATAMPPGRVAFATAISRPGLSQENFAQLLQKDFQIGILIELEYTDTFRRETFTDVVCLERLATGAIAFRPPEGCKK